MNAFPVHSFLKEVWLPLSRAVNTSSELSGKLYIFYTCFSDSSWCLWFSERSPLTDIIWKSAGFAHGVRRIFQGFGLILGPLWASSLMSRPYWLFGAMLALTVMLTVSFCLFFVNASIVLNSSEYHYVAYIVLINIWWLSAIETLLRKV